MENFPKVTNHSMIGTTDWRLKVSYKIVRFHFNKENEVIATGLTLEEAQEHCNRDDTHGEGWFDGYTEEDDE